MRLYCTEEHHAAGGNGSFYLMKAEDALTLLLERYENGVRLIYLDPPFRTGESFKMRIGKGKQAQTVVLYEDKLNEESYLKWLERILRGCHRLLDPQGSIYLHLDYRMSHKARVLLDETFGESNFMNEIIWAYRSGGRATRCYPRKHDTILFYRKSKKVYFNIKAVGTPRGPERRNHMKRFIDEDGRIGFSIRSNGKTYTYYEDSLIYPSDVWSDIEHLQQKDRERTGFLTQKPEALLKRIIAASSAPGDLVLDLFSGRHDRLRRDEARPAVHLRRSEPRRVRAAAQTPARHHERTDADRKRARIADDPLSGRPHAVQDRRRDHPERRQALRSAQKNHVFR